MEIRRSDRADEDLIDIWFSVADDNPFAADRVIDAIVQRWEQLAAHPFSGPPREDIAPDVRHLLTEQYITLYRVEPGVIRILRVLHGRRNIGGGSLLE